VMELFRLMKDPREHEARRLLSHLAEDRFNLVVVGQFKRGKSSLMNAVIGMDRLPTGILPLTSVVTTVRYGDHEAVLIRTRGSSLTQEIPLERLEEYVTEKGNPGNRKHVEVAEVLLPSEVLRLGFHFIDTPGVGSSIKENTAATYQFLPQADAVVFVTGFESAMNEGEVGFLRNVGTHVRKIFVAVNKLDLVSPKESDEVLDSVRRVVSMALGASEPRVFPVSARFGLEAKLSGDRDMLSRSGLPELESALTRFLTSEREQTSLLRCIERAAALLMPERIETPPSEARRILSGDSGDVSALLDKLETMRRELTDGNRDKAVMLSPIAAAMRVIRSCYVCERVEAELFDFFAKRQSELSVNEAHQREHVRTGGFCPLHTWQFAQIASPHGIALAYAPLLAAIARDLRRIVSSGSSTAFMRNGISRLLASTESCPACRKTAEVEELAAAEFRQASFNPDGDDADAGLCVPHLMAVLNRETDPDIVRTLVSEQANTLDRIAEVARTYNLKHDALRRELTTDEEATAYFVGLSLLVGHKRLSAA